MGGKSQLHKGKAAGAGKNEQAQGFLCSPPGQGCRPRPRPKKGVSSAKRSQHPLGMWLPRGWEDSHRALLPGWRRRASREPSHHIKAPGEGVEVPPSPIVCSPKEDGGGRKVALSSGLPLSCGCNGEEQLQKGPIFFAFSPKLSRHSGSCFQHQDA